MIANFGIPAAPVSFLIALRYLISPLSLWAGYRSDTQPLFGFQRTSYIWIGRLLMLISLPLLGFSLMQFEANATTSAGWLLALTSSLLYGIGTLISGSPYLALVRDSVPAEKQGLAISIVETILILFFAVTGIIFGAWMEVYDPRLFWELVFATMFIGGFFWFFAIAGIEKRSKKAPHPALHALVDSEIPAVNSFAETFRVIWSDPRARGFFLFLSLATLSAWIQDAILEPFGGDVFSFSAGRTTRFNSYWQTATVITLVASMLVWRKRPPEQQGKIAAAGLGVMALGMASLAICSYTRQASFVEPSLLLFGAGFGAYTFGGLSLMAVMSADRKAGVYLGLWTVSILVFKGLGTFLGGALRDVFYLSAGLSAGISYGLVYSLATAGLFLSIYQLSRVDIIGFARDYGRSLEGAETTTAVSEETQSQR